jgi:hypothetical protein
LIKKGWMLATSILSRVIFGGVNASAGRTTKPRTTRRTDEMVAILFIVSSSPLWGA